MHSGRTDQVAAAAALVVALPDLVATGRGPTDVPADRLADAARALSGRAPVLLAAVLRELLATPVASVGRAGPGSLVGSDTLQALREHARDPARAAAYPLAHQPYRTVLGPLPDVRLRLGDALAAAPWPGTPLAALAAGLVPGERGATRAAAARLGHDLLALCGEAGSLAVAAARLWRPLTGGPHLLQREALAAAAAVAPVAGRRCLDIGCGAGELVAALRALGADAHGSERDTGPGPFGIGAAPDWDVVFATGVLEPGAWRGPDGLVSPIRFAAEADALFAAAAARVRPGGLLVVRSVSEPIALGPAAATAAGLRPVALALPLALPAQGGRLGVWQRIRTAWR